MRYKYTTARQEGGDDGFCYVIRAKGTGRVIIEGLTRSECPHYRQGIESAVEQGKRDSHTLHLIKEEP